MGNGITTQDSQTHRGMKKKKMMSDITYEDLSYRLRNEGEGYALKHYYGPNIDHKDEKVVRLWKEAHDKLIELEEYLQGKINEDEYDELA
jgi:hypothetical protein